VKRGAILAVAAATYLLAAWMVAPGFYDGFGPPQAYNWTCPPPQAGANIKPKSGHLEIKVINGKSDANSAFTDDGQIVIGFLPGAFDTTGRTTITVDITPRATRPQPPGLKSVTDVYQITATPPRVTPPNPPIRSPTREPQPPDVSRPGDPEGAWHSMGHASTAPPFTIITTTTKLGYFAAGYKQSSPASGAVVVGGGQVLPIIVAILIVVVVLAGLPLAMMRRRRSSGDKSDGDEP